MWETQTLRSKVSPSRDKRFTPVIRCWESLHGQTSRDYHATEEEVSTLFEHWTTDSKYVRGPAMGIACLQDHRDGYKEM